MKNETETLRLIWDCSQSIEPLPTHHEGQTARKHANNYLMNHLIVNPDEVETFHQPSNSAVLKGIRSVPETNKHPGSSTNL